MASMDPPSGEWRHREIIANGVRLHYVEAGPAAAPLALLLHGFPECWYSWRHQLPALANAGYHVVAPDLRGYGRSEKPPGVDAYGIQTLVADVAALIDALGGGEPAALVAGHDWGGGIVWALGALQPQQARALAVINCPHARALLRAWRRPAQLLRSWYIAFFQLPLLPEVALRAGGLRIVDAAFAPGRRRSPAMITPADVAYLRRELARPGALTCAINYYRALRRQPPRTVRRLARPVAAPVLLIWGVQDPALLPELTEGMEEWAPNCRLVRLADAGHFCHQEYPERVNRSLLDWLRSLDEAADDRRWAPANAGGG